MNSSELARQMRKDAERADALRAEASELLVRAVRSGYAAGLSQREIAECVGRSQPEISRLVRFHGRTPLGRAVTRKRTELTRAIKRAGGRNPRVFGSVARGDDTLDSDVDLLVDLPRDMSLFSLGRLERELSSILGHPVDVVPADQLRVHLGAQVHDDAVPL